MADGRATCTNAVYMGFGYYTVITWSSQRTAGNMTWTIRWSFSDFTQTSPSLMVVADLTPFLSTSILYKLLLSILIRLPLLVLKVCNNSCTRITPIVRLKVQYAELLIGQQIGEEMLYNSLRLD